jgi:sodium transport system permease protein
MRDRILEVRTFQRDSVYRAAGFPVAMEEVAPLESESVATAAKEAGAFLGVALMPFLVLLMLSGGSIVAVDAISGEKERGTLETLLTTAADRTDIVRAKLLAVIAVGLAVAVINVLNLIAYLVVGLLDLPTSLAVELGALEVVLLLLLFVPVAVLIAAALLLLSGASKSFKDYQVRFLPVLVVIGFPSMAAVLPGIDLRSAVAFFPMAGIAVAVREILVGEIDLLFILIAFLSTGGLAVWLTRLTQDTLSNEKLISGSDLDEADLVGGAALFPRHVFRWFLTLWVIFFLASLWWGEELGVRGQVLVNLVLIFFGGSLVMIRHYRLDPREAFGLRLPHPAAWLAVLLGAPAALMVGVGLAEFVNTWVFPVPEQVLENFGNQLVEPDLPIWQLVFFLSIMPGVFEELAFRGVLLHGMRKRIKSKWVIALLNGVIFGIFHVSLFRIAPTAWLGFVLTWVVLLGGSVYPVMLWHALNNGIAIVPAAAGWLPEDFTPESWWAFPALLLLTLSFWILWRTAPRVEESPP